MKKDFLTIQDLTREELVALVDRALQIKKEGKRSTGSLSG